MDFITLQNANDIISTTNIKGKEYAEVNQRIKAFRYLYPNGCITTEMLSCADGIVTFKAIATDEEGNILGTGHAQEKESSTFINKTSYIENCETSAVGRALGMCGIGIDTSVASYEEVKNAIVNQSAEDTAPKVICPKCGIQMLKMTSKSGKVWAPTDIINKYGMCKECYEKEKLSITKKQFNDMVRNDNND